MDEGTITVNSDIYCFYKGKKTSAHYTDSPILWMKVQILLTLIYLYTLYSILNLNINPVQPNEKQYTPNLSPFKS